MKSDDLFDNIMNELAVGVKGGFALLRLDGGKHVVEEPMIGAQCIKETSLLHGGHGNLEPGFGCRACVELVNAPGAGEGDGRVPREENHEDVSHGGDGVQEGALPPLKLARRTDFVLGV